MTNPGVIERYAAAWQRSDLAVMFAIYDPDVIVHYGGASQFAGDHHGRDALIALLTETGRRGGRTLVSVDAIYDLGGHGALFVTETFDIDGEPVTVERCLRYRVNVGMIAEVWLYDHQQHLVDQAWSQP